jgi:polyisoprenyl-phosphate glycosyltransferase
MTTHLASPQPMALSIVVPCYNEEAVLSETYARLFSLRERLIATGKISRRSDIVFVDDGSCDRTWNMIDEWVRGGSPVVGVKLSRNCGHQNALIAGLSSAKGDAVITIDADLQDDEGAIERMVDAFHEGHEVVYGVRAKRDTDTWFKRTTARTFYRAMKALGVQTVIDHADYRLLSRRAIKYLDQFNEVNLFLRGVIPLLGLRSAVVHYDRRARFAGESKYPVRKMLEFALNGVTSFSTAPLRAIALLGFTLSLACLALAGWVLAVKFFSSNAVPGWASTILPIYFLGGVQLLCAGVLGEYVGKIYMEIKRRPRFLVERVAGQSQSAVSDSKRHIRHQFARGLAPKAGYDATGNQPGGAYHGPERRRARSDGAAAEAALATVAIPGL